MARVREYGRRQRREGRKKENRSETKGKIERWQESGETRSSHSISFPVDLCATSRQSGPLFPIGNLSAIYSRVICTFVLCFDISSMQLPYVSQWTHVRQTNAFTIRFWKNLILCIDRSSERQLFLARSFELKRESGKMRT